MPKIPCGYDLHLGLSEVWKRGPGKGADKISSLSKHIILQWPQFGLKDAAKVIHSEKCVNDFS